MRLPLCAALALACAASAHAAAGEQVTTLADQRGVAVTIYNEDLALIKDTRRVALPAGGARLAWRDVSARMRPETALLRDVTRAANLALLEQNFDFDLLTPQKLLQKYVGRRVVVIRTNPATGAETREDATVLAANQGVVLKYADRIETGIPGRIAYPGVPETLRERPTLVVSLEAARAANDLLELSYLSGGLAWKADYVAELAPREDRMALDGWVTLTNRSGAAYPDARLQLVAGDVNRVQEELQPAPRLEGLAMARAKAAPMAEEGLFEYHLYTLGRPTTIADNQTKQVALMSASGIRVQKEFVLRGADYYYRSSVGEIGQKMKVAVYLKFENKGTGLGIPLPKGVVRVYKRDSAGNAQFVGEDRIDHTPKNETVRLRMGNAFDLTADKKQTSFVRLPRSAQNRNAFEAGFEIRLRNAKDEPATVRVQEPIPGDWKILAESQPHTKETAHTAVWRIRVPANGAATLTYSVRVRY